MPGQEEREDLLGRFEGEWQTGRRPPLAGLLQQAGGWVSVMFRRVNGVDRSGDMSLDSVCRQFGLYDGAARSVWGGGLPLQVTRQVDALCDEFEAALDCGDPPPLTDFLQRVDPAVGKVLLRELGAMSLDWLAAHGCADPVGELAVRNPLLAEELRTIGEEWQARSEREEPFSAVFPRSGKEGPLPAAAAGPRGVPDGSREVRCPRCEESTEIALMTPRMQVNCLHCGSQFSLLQEPTDSGRQTVMIPVDHFQFGDRIAKYEVRRLLGVGSFGSVYLCWDPDLKREVAIKVAHPHLRPAGGAFEEQLAEAQRVAAIDCAGVVPVYEGGRMADGRAFFVMKLVRGRTLDQWRRDERPGPVAAAAMVARIAEVIAIVHSRGVVHRDLKPGNILVDLDGVPFVADFGLARSMSDQRQRVLAGTPAYMAPEQVSPAASTADARTDVWALGVILYELLAGRRPFAGGDLWDTCRRIVSEAVSFERGASQVPARLQRICLKCLQRSPEMRFPSASDLADALWRECPAAERPPARRPRLGGRALAGAVGLAGVVLATSAWLAARTHHRAQGIQQVAARQTSDVADKLYRLDMAQAYGFWDKGWVDQVQKVLGAQVPRAGQPDRRGFEWQLLSTRVSRREPLVLSGHQGVVNELAVFPDGRRIASVGADGTLRIWDVPTETCLLVVDMARTLPGIDLAHGGLHSVAISSDGRYVAAAADVVGLLDLQQDNQVRPLFRSDFNVESMAFSTDGQRLALGTRYDGLALVSLEGKLLAQVANRERMNTLDYLPGEQQWLTPFRSQTHDSAQVAALWDDHLLQQRRVFDVTSLLGYSHISFARVSPCGRFLCVTSRSSADMLLLDIASAEVVSSSPASHRAVLADFCFAPDGGAIALAHVDGQVRYQRLQAVGDRIKFAPDVETLVGHQGEARCVRFLDSDRLVTCGDDGLVKVWDQGQSTRKVTVPLRFAAGCEFSPDGSQLLVQEGSEIVILTSVTGEVRNRWSPAVLGGVAATWSPLGERVAIWSKTERKVWLMDVTDVQPRPFFSADFRPNSVAFSPDGEMVVVAGGGNLRLLDCQTGRELARQQVLDGVRLCRFSQDGTQLAVGGGNELYLCDSTEPLNGFPITGSRGVECMAFSADGALLATGHNDSIVRLWRLADRSPVGQLVGHNGQILSVSFSPDGRTLLSTSCDGELRVWSVPGLTCYGTVDRHDGLGYVAISPRGDRLAILYAAPDADSARLVIWSLEALLEAPEGAVVTPRRVGTGCVSLEEDRNVEPRPASRPPPAASC